MCRIGLIWLLNMQPKNGNDPCLSMQRYRWVTTPSWLSSARIITSGWLWSDLRCHWQQVCERHRVNSFLWLDCIPWTLSSLPGIVDDLTAAGVPCFGPAAKAAQLEASKSFSKAFMERHGIPTARYGSFTDPQEACNYIRTSVQQKDTKFGSEFVHRSQVEGHAGTLT